jgi:hypothetical protein
MDEFKGKKRRVVPLTGCKAAPRFQCARYVTHVPVADAAWHGVGSLAPLFLTLSDLKLKNAELCQRQDQFHTF